MKILVTGSSGFIGAHVQRRLVAAGHVVAPFDIVRGDDILDRGSVDRAIGSGTEIVYHIAAQSDLTKISDLDDGSRAVDLNVTGTHNIVNACARYGVWLVYASTCCAYGNQEKFPAHEDTAVPNPSELYAFTKLGGEEIARGYGANFGLPYTILRLSTVYGPGMRETLAPHVFFDQAYRGSDITVHGTGKQTRAQIYVDDLVDGIVATQAHPAAKGHIINLAGNQSISALQMAEDIRRLVNSPSRIVHVKDRTNQTRHEEFSTEKARTLLHWQARTPWLEGLEKTAKWLESTKGYGRKKSPVPAATLSESAES